MKIAKLLDLHGKLTPLSIHDEAAEGLVSGLLSTGRLKRSFHVLEVTNSGSDVYSAGDGLVRLTRYTPGGRITYSVVSHVKILRQFVRWSYYQATKVRLASKSCSLDDAV